MFKKKKTEFEINFLFQLSLFIYMIISFKLTSKYFEIIWNYKFENVF